MLVWFFILNKQWHWWYRAVKYEYTALVCLKQNLLREYCHVSPWSPAIGHIRQSELTWLYPMSSFHSKQNRAVCVNRYHHSGLYGIPYDYVIHTNWYLRASLMANFHLLRGTCMYDKHLIIVYFPHSGTHYAWLQVTVLWIGVRQPSRKTFVYIPQSLVCEKPPFPMAEVRTYLSSLQAKGGI